MNRSVRLAPVFLAALLAGLLVALLALGWYGQRQAEQVEADLLDQRTIATQLTALEQAADDSGNTLLSQASQAALASLAPAAREVPVTDYEPLEKQLESTASTLLEVGLTTQKVDDRARALTALMDLWQAASQEELTSRAYPEALTHDLEKISNYTCDLEKPGSEVAATQSGEQVTQASSLLSLQESIYRLNYVSEVYAARAQQGYAEVAGQAEQLAAVTGKMSQLAAPVLTCYGAFEAAAASYPLADPAEAPQQLADFTAAIESNARASLADQALATSADDLEILVLLLTLEAQQVTS